MDMSIAALSVSMSQSRVNQDMGVSVLKLALNASEEGLQEILPSNSVSLDPALGQYLDLNA